MSSRSNKQIIAVINATAIPGRYVAEAIRDHSEKNWTVRGLTANVESKAAEKLSKKGIEVFPCDFRKPDQLRVALQDVHGLYLSINFWDSRNGTDTNVFNLVKSIIDIAAECNVYHIIYSGLEGIEGGEEFGAPSRGGKYSMQEYIRSKKFPRHTFIHMGFFYENFLNALRPRIMETNFIFEIPAANDDMKLPLCTPRDVGPVVARVFDCETDMYHNQIIPVVGDILSIKEIMLLIQFLRSPVTIHAAIDGVKYEMKKQSKSTGIGEALEYFQYFLQKHGDTIWQGKKLYPKLRSLDDWIARTNVQDRLFA